MADHALRKLAPSDFFRFKFIGRPVVSPDGTRVAYTVALPDADKNGYCVNVFVYDVPTGTSSQFTYGNGQDTSPKWSPDGKALAFVSDRGGDKQVWVMLANGGEARQLSKVKDGVSDFEWSPDGKTVGFITKWDGSAAEESKDDKKYKSDTKVYTRIKYKFDGRGFWDHKWRHIWVVDVASREQTQLTHGDYDDDGIAWSPDSKEIAFASARFEDADVKNVKDLWAVNVKTKEARQVIKSKGPVSDPVWHPDGTRIGYLGHDNAQNNTTNTGIWTVPSAGGEPVNMLAGHDISVGGGITGDMHYAIGGADWTWSSCGDAAYFLACVKGNAGLYRIASDGSFSEIIGCEGEVIGFDFSRCGDVYFSLSDLYNPGDLYRAAPGAEKARLTSVNKEILGEVELAHAVKLALKGVDGWDIQGWLMKPPGFDPSKKYPMVLEVHGGPHSMYGNTFDLEFQLLVAKGYLVLYTNPRGSEGYGEVFKGACKGDYGGKDYGDLMLAVDQVIAMGFVDDKNMGVGGGSYGGFMTSWVVGHTDRFRAAVAMRSVNNWVSFHGTSDIGFTFTENEIKGNPWDQMETLIKHSPFTYVKNVVTPLLILHGEQDHRCPIEQGEQMFAALKKLKREVEFVRFPGESHDMSRSGKPHHRVERLERILSWFDRWFR